MESKYKLARMLLACARSMIAAKINDSQRRMIDEYAGYRSKDLDFGTAFDWDAAGRAYIPVNRSINDREAPQEIVDALKKLGYSITSYREGKAIKTIEVRDGKKTVTKNIGRILKNEVNDDDMYKMFMNRLGTSNKNQKRDFIICITHNPEDVGAMSTGRNWTSCMELPEYDGDEGGEYYETALSQVQYGGMCAYLIDKNDRTVERPYARIALKRLESKDGGFIYEPEERIYGDWGLAAECGMENAVERELGRANRITRKSGAMFGTADPGSYSDSHIKYVKYHDDFTDDQILAMNDFDFKDGISNSGRSFDEKFELVCKYVDNLQSIQKKREIIQWSCEKFHWYIAMADRLPDLVDWGWISRQRFNLSYNDDLAFLKRHRDRIKWDVFIGERFGMTRHDAVNKKNVGKIFSSDYEQECFEREFEIMMSNFRDEILAEENRSAGDGVEKLDGRWRELMDDIMLELEPNAVDDSWTSHEVRLYKEHHEWKCDTTLEKFMYEEWNGASFDGIKYEIDSIEKSCANDMARHYFLDKSGSDFLKMYENDELDDDVREQYLDNVMMTANDINCRLILSLDVDKSDIENGIVKIECNAEILVFNEEDDDTRETTYSGETSVGTATECESRMREMVKAAFNSMI